jgi:hypothetical protein
MIERFTFDRLRITVLFVALAGIACMMPAQNDTWWLLRAGQDMWATRHVLLTDTYSHTVYGARWPNHEWLTQLIFYSIYALGGLPLLTLACAGVVTAAWAVVWVETPSPTKSKFLMTLFLFPTATTMWSLRAQVLSLLLVVSTAALLRRRRLAWLPLLFWVWANLHGGVLLGVLLLGAALGAAVLEDIARLPRLATTAVLCLVATTLTPLGWHFWLDVPQSLERIRQLGIDEWARPSIATPTLIPFWITIAALTALAVTRGRVLLSGLEARRDGRVTMCACALALVPVALTAVRNVPPFLMLALPAIAALMPVRHAAASATRAERTRLNAVLAVAAATLALVAVAGAYRHRLPRLNWMPLPAASLTALDRCQGNVYNRYDEGGYLIWFAPGRRVFLDGRQDPYPPALIKEQIEVETSGEFRPLFARYDIGCAYVPTSSRVAAGLVRAGWRLLFRDRAWTVLANSRLPRTATLSEARVVQP